MIDYVAIVVSSSLVIWLIHRFKLVQLAQQVLLATKQANAINADKNIDELQKEQQTQAAAKKLLRLFVLLFTGSAGAFLLPLLPVYGLSMLDLVSLDNIYTIMSTIEFIVIFSIIAVISLFKVGRG
jgi:hypothetical protein